MDLISRLFELKQSARSAVVSEAGYTDFQQRMHVPDEIENWVVARIESWRSGDREQPLLIMLSGNAGDGKSDLIERVLGRTSVDDIDVVRDATHADTPTVDQTAELASFFEPFADGSSLGAPPRVSLIAMNTGMALSFLANAAGASYGLGFGDLEGVIKSELGLGRERPDVPWDYEIINLDRRSILQFGDRDAIFTGMLEKLDPDNEDGLLWEEGQRCTECDAREACFVRANLNLLRLPETRSNLTELLWRVTLSGEVHVSPRNSWDLLYQVTTGGDEFFSGATTPCDKIAELKSEGVSAAPQIHQRLLHNLLFESPTPEQRGPLLEALGAADPCLRVGRHGHLAESSIYNNPAKDAPIMGEAAARAQDTSTVGPDPCLNWLASTAKAGHQWPEEARRLFGRGAIRRARVLDTPGAIAAELHDPDLEEFSALLTSYREWEPGTAAPEEVRDFKALLVSAVERVFGISVGAASYFRQDSFSPATRYPAYASVDLSQAIEPAPDDDVSRGSHWLSAINYRPQFVTIEIRGGGDVPWRIRGDLALFRLFRRVLAGYAASSVDLEAFFGLRYACESLGTASTHDELVIRSTETGAVFRLREREELGETVVELTEVSA